MRNQKISYASLEVLTDAAPTREVEHAIDQAVRGINSTEERITTLVGQLRHRLDDVERKLAAGLNLNELGELQRTPAELDHAIAARQIHWQTLAALIGSDAAAALSRPAA